mmetsp:Transcript_2442/g.2183  ORF Transcript_2442/g.2183 Transcript_2442/m.2183 type:complete len:94 (-) Transcript_2442:74-355(-)
MSSSVGTVSIDAGNPITIIQNRLQLLRTEREQSLADMESLEVEKRAIKAVLPKLLYELQQIRESLELNYKDLSTYDKAIKEFERTYGRSLDSY